MQPCFGPPGLCLDGDHGGVEFDDADMLILLMVMILGPNAFLTHEGCSQLV